MYLILFCICMVVLFADDKRKTCIANQKVSEMDARGEFLHKDYSRFRQIWSDVDNDWANDRKLFPKEYWAYFDYHKDAKTAYVQGLVGQQEMKEGLKPVLCPPYYNKNTFNPFGAFDEYRKKIKEYNETGKTQY